MGKRIRDWFASWMGVSRVSRQVAALRRRVDRLRKEKNILERDLEDHRYYLKNVGDEVKKALQTVDRANGLNKKLEQALETAQREIETFEEVTIPGLIASSKTLIDRWDAESSILAMRSVAARAAQQRDVE